MENTSSDDTPFAATMTLPAGKYKIVYKQNDCDFGPQFPLFNDNLINNAENVWNLNESDMFNYLYFTDYNVIDDENGNSILTGTINISKDTKYYILGNINKIGTGPEITIKGSSISSVAVNGEENIYLLPAEVSSYKDAGVSYNSKTLTGNDVYTYTNLKDKETYEVNPLLSLKDLNGYVKKWEKTKYASFFLLSNNTIQVIFNDRTEVHFNLEEKYVNYIDRARNNYKEKLNIGKKFQNEEMNKRIAYAQNILISKRTF